jgi:hypothetical protein
MIPGAVKSVEFVSVVSDREQHAEHFYTEYSGRPLKIVSSQTERLPPDAQPNRLIEAL